MRSMRVVIKITGCEANSVPYHRRIPRAIKKTAIWLLGGFYFVFHTHTTSFGLRPSLTMDNAVQIWCSTPASYYYWLTRQSNQILNAQINTNNMVFVYRWKDWNYRKCTASRIMKLMNSNLLRYLNICRNSISYLLINKTETKHKQETNILAILFGWWKR